MVLRLLGTAVFHQALHHVPVHQRLTAKKVHFQMLPVPRIGNEEIQGLFANLIAHQGTAAVVFPFLCKTISAGQVAVMGNVKAKGLDHCLALLKIHNKITVNILCKKLLHGDQLLDVLKGLSQLLGCVFAPQAVKYIRLDLGRQGFRLFHLRNQL